LFLSNLAYLRLFIFTLFFTVFFFCVYSLSIPDFFSLFKSIIGTLSNCTLIKSTRISFRFLKILSMCILSLSILNWLSVLCRLILVLTISPYIVSGISTDKVLNLLLNLINQILQKLIFGSFITLVLIVKGLDSFFHTLNAFFIIFSNIIIIRTFQILHFLLLKLFLFLKVRNAIFCFLGSLFHCRLQYLALI
jgi:hypothetical protein